MEDSLARQCGRPILFFTRPDNSALATHAGLHAVRVSYARERCASKALLCLWRRCATSACQWRKAENENAAVSAASSAETADTAACNAKVFINAPPLLRNGVLCWQGGPRPKPGPPPELPASLAATRACNDLCSLPLTLVLTRLT